MNSYNLRVYIRGTSIRTEFIDAPADQAAIDLMYVSARTWPAAEEGWLYLAGDPNSIASTSGEGR